MAEEKPSLHIDLDWKKQAQEEKKRLEEEEKKRAEERAAAASAAPTPAGVLPTTPTGGVPAGPGAAGAAAATAERGRTARGGRAIPPANVQTLAQSLVSQALYYLSDIAAQRGDEMSNLDMAKHLIDTLGVLEEKTANNLTPEEQQVLDTALYESRMRFINVAGQVIAGA
jgi:hypothetical protein